MRLIHGDALGTLPELADASIDAVITDPPYGLEFMGKEWDSPIKMPGHSHGLSGGWQKTSGAHSEGYRQMLGQMEQYQKWCELWARECFRVLKPGGHLLAFGGSRTYHRLAVAVEDAGFEIRDSIVWIYGSGFPKSLNVSKAIESGGGRPEDIRRMAMGDEYEPSGRGRLAYDHGGASVMNGAVGPFEPATDDAKRWAGWGTALKPAHEPIVVARKPLIGTVAANVLAHGTGALNIDACRVEGRERTDYGLTTATRTQGATYGTPSASADFDASMGRWPANVVLDEDAAAELDEQSGTTRSRSGGTTTKALGVMNDDAWVARDLPRTGHDDSGGASRFFPVFRYQAKAPTRERPKVDGVAHPTVKPLDLMRWLVRLVTPPGGLVLDPFAGSGTTLEAAALEAMDGIGIEREASYLPLIVERMRRAGVELDAQSLAPAVPRPRTPAEWLAHFGITEGRT